MKKLLFSILCAFMVSTMASAQYLNVKLKDGTYHSYKTSSDMEVSFGDKAGAEIMEPVQVVKLYKGDQLVAKYRAPQVDRVVYEEAQPTTGTANATINNVETPVKWVQLWEDGPKFAEYNVGATSAKEYGGLYCWGMTKDKDSNAAFNVGKDALSGTDDTATNIWGSNWRMPTKEELDKLRANCDVVWTNVGGLNGSKFTGKGDYSSNSVFLPAAGYCDSGSVKVQGSYGYYWSSTPCGSNDANSYYLYLYSGNQDVGLGEHCYGCSVRAVLNENE